VTIWIGLTGGIGSGKSQAAAEFSFLGVPVLDADAVSRELTGENGKALPLIRKCFGESVFMGAQLNRAVMRQLVMARSNLSESEVRKIIAAQSENSSRYWMANEIILNNGNKDELTHKIGRLNQYYQSCFNG